ncbi:MAG: hypothetical protein DBY30_01350 [Verrucomicrobia bacterium]|nr:MAG: hypothetical protein DBY30_01350 [Verrucomicrobiota bacterium]
MLDLSNLKNLRALFLRDGIESIKTFQTQQIMATDRQTENSRGEKPLTLADLPVGATATVVKIIPNSRGEKKFSDVGLVPGTELLMQAHAPFGGLIRVKVMQTSMALHSSDAKNILLKKGGENEKTL